MNEVKKIMTLMALAMNQYYLPEVREVKDIEVLTECPKCGKEYPKYTPKYCTECKKRLWSK